MTSKRLALVALVGFALVACSVETIKTGAPAASDSPAEPTPGDDGTTPTDPPDSGTPDPSKPDASKPDASKPPQCTAKRWYRDSDGDGFGAAATFSDACDQPSGYVSDKTDCDDTKSTIKPTAIELCDAIDSNCDGNVNGTAAESAACTAKTGSYTGTFTMYTAEKLGATIVNQMTCTGTTTMTVDLSATVVVKGAVSCNYPGSLGGFDHNQSGTIAASVRPDGTLEGSLTYTFGSGMTRTFTIKGTGDSGRIDSTTKTSWLPNPMSAVPWETTITIASAKN